MNNSPIDYPNFTLPTDPGVVYLETNVVYDAFISSARDPAFQGQIVIENAVLSYANVQYMLVCDIDEYLIVKNGKVSDLWESYTSSSSTSSPSSVGELQIKPFLLKAPFSDGGESHTSNVSGALCLHPRNKLFRSQVRDRTNSKHPTDLF